MNIQAPQAGRWTCEQGNIRITPAGQPSIYDMIRVLGGQKNPHQVWERLTETHAEVVPKCENFRFHGRGQRDTPVARTKQDAYYILGLLPGEAGKRYREDAARLFTAFLSDPASVATAALERMSPEEREHLELRLKGVRTRHQFTDVLQQHGVIAQGYAACTNAIYIPILGSNTTVLKARIASTTNLPLKQIKTRDHLSLKELGDVETAERVAAGQLRRSNVTGNAKVESLVRRSAEYTRLLLDGEVSIPGLSLGS